MDNQNGPEQKSGFRGENKADVTSYVFVVNSTDMI